MMSMKMHTSLPLILLLGGSMLPERANAQTDPNSSGAPSPPTVDSHAPAWLFPIEKLNESLPSWLHIGGEYRDRLEGPIGIGFKGTNDFYLLDRLRVAVAIQPNDWLKFYGEVQDSRIFFNHHIANANPFEDSWTLWQGYAQVGSSTSGWVDALAGRQVLAFGDERVIAPSNWLNVGRGHLNEVTIGLHVKGTLLAEFDYDTEFDGQKGSLGPSSIGAWAGYAGVGKTFPNIAGAPRVFIEGNYASGTKSPAGRDWSTFDQLYPSNHDKYGFTDQVGRRNLVQFRVGVEENVGEKWKVKQAFDGYWLATSNDNFYASSGAIAVPAHPGASRHIGNELDLVAEFTLNKGLNFGLGYARLFAGQFLKTTTPGHDYSYPFAYVEYNFSKSAFHS